MCRIKSYFLIFALLFCNIWHTVFVLGKNTHLQECASVFSNNIAACAAQKTNLFDRDGKPCQILSQILDLTGVQHNNTRADIMKATQNPESGWIRPAGKERWEIIDKHANKRDKLMPLFDALGLVKRKSPSKKFYNYAIIHGALLERVRLRLDYLVQEWNRGLRFDKLVLLTGYRQLTEQEIIELNALFGKNSDLIAKSEAEMVWALYASTDMSQSLKNIPVMWVNAQPPPGSMRATTAATIQSWLKMEPKSGTIIAVSSQPFVDYQNSVLKGILAGSWQLESIGAAAPEDTTVGIYLDNLARIIYEEEKQAKNLGKIA